MHFEGLSPTIISIDGLHLDSLNMFEPNLFSLRTIFLNRIVFLVPGYHDKQLRPQEEASSDEDEEEEDEDEDEPEAATSDMKMNDCTQPCMGRMGSYYNCKVVSCILSRIGKETNNTHNSSCSLAPFRGIHLSSINRRKKKRLTMSSRCWKRH